MKPTWNFTTAERQSTSESLQEDVNAAPHTIPTGTITVTNKLMYTTAAVILEMLGYKMDNAGSSKRQYPQWRQRLDTKIQATRREVSQPSELQKGATKKELPEKYNKLSIPEALETAKQ